MKWRSHHIDACRDIDSLSIISDNEECKQYQTDFGGVAYMDTPVVFIPKKKSALVQLLKFSSERKLHLTVRCLGFSQSGQSIAQLGGAIVIVSFFNDVSDVDKKNLTISAQCGASIGSLVKKTLCHGLLPSVLPHNTSISIGGLLSAGGVGAASFKHGLLCSSVITLEVLTVSGDCLKCSRDQNAELFYAVLAGQGQMGIILEATFQLKKVKSNIVTFYLLYDDPKAWLNDQQQLSQSSFVFGMEAFTSPLVHGLHNTSQGRKPLVSYAFNLQLSIEYESHEPSLDSLDIALQYSKYIYSESNELSAYVRRHQPRFDNLMHKLSTESVHPWYECFVSSHSLELTLDKMLPYVFSDFGGVLQTVFINKQQANSFISLPDGENIVSVAVLPTGLTKQQLPSCLKAIEYFDSLLLSTGGKRYISGYLGHYLSANSKRRPYAKTDLIHAENKRQFDPENILSSSLLPS